MLTRFYHESRIYEKDLTRGESVVVPNKRTEDILYKVYKFDFTLEEHGEEYPHKTESGTVYYIRHEVDRRDKKGS